MRGSEVVFLLRKKLNCFLEQMYEKQFVVDCAVVTCAGEVSRLVCLCEFCEGKSMV